MERPQGRAPRGERLVSAVAARPLEDGLIRAQAALGGGR